MNKLARYQLSMEQPIQTRLKTTLNTKLRMAVKKLKTAVMPKGWKRVKVVKAESRKQLWQVIVTLGLPNQLRMWRNKTVLNGKHW